MIKNLNILENYNFSVADIMLYNFKQNKEVSPLKLLQKRKREGVEKMYEIVAEVHLIE
jgi:hypothetical protein